MRQVLAMNPLASAMRNGPFLAAYWKNFVCGVQGAKHSGSADGPATTFGPASDGVAFIMQAAVNNAATAVARRRYWVRFTIFLPRGWSLVRGQTTETSTP